MKQGLVHADSGAVAKAEKSGWQCHFKIPHESRQLAKRHAAGLNKSRNVKAKSASWVEYRCVFCGNWHVSRTRSR